MLEQLNPTTDDATLLRVATRVLFDHLAELHERDEQTLNLALQIWGGFATGMYKLED